MSKIKFTINGQEHEIGGEYGPSFSLNSYIRNVVNLRGTKAMCHEGGCGICIVSAKIMDPISKEEQVLAVNSCLVSVLSCHGWAITTIEGLGGKNDGYHDIQKRLAHFNGTQCGYCSPGWVMNMYSLLESNNHKMTMKEIENSFAGNLCRCTGYRPIADAFKSFASDAPKDLLDKVYDLEDLDQVKKCFGKCDENYKCSKKNKCSSKRNRINSEDGWLVIDKNIGLENVKAEVIHINCSDGCKWFKVYTIDDVFEVIKHSESYMFLAGNTGQGVIPMLEFPETVIDIASVDELKGHTIEINLILGAGMTITEMITVFKQLSSEKDDFAYLSEFKNHLDLVAHIPVKNIGTIGGNLSLKHQNNSFQSDIFLLFETVGAVMTIMSGPGKMDIFTMTEYLNIDMKGKIILDVMLPPLSKETCIVKTYKIMQRSQNAHAIVNGGFLFQFDFEKKYIEHTSIVYGGISSDFNHASNTEKTLRGKDIFKDEVLQLAVKSLADEIFPEDIPPEPSPSYRKMLAICLFYKAILSICSEEKMSPRVKSGGNVIQRGLSSGLQMFDTDKSLWPLNQPIPKKDGLVQCSGEATFANDLMTQPDEVYGAFVLSKDAHGTIEKIDATKALALKGVCGFYTAKDIPGVNSFTPVNAFLQEYPEEILCSGKILYHGQPVAIVTAKTERIASRASSLVEVIVKKSPNYKPVLTIDDAIKAPDSKERMSRIVDVEPKERGKNVKKVIFGEFCLTSQYHFTMETQTTIARPVEDGIELISSTQYMNLTNIAVAKCLGMDCHQINVIVRRLGGGYGAKITRATQMACAAGLITKLTNRTCRFVMPLTHNMAAVGKRFPTRSKFEVGVDSAGEIQYLVNDVYQDNGSSKNETIVTFVVPHFFSGYKTDRWKFVGSIVLTDTPSNTWVRAPGSTEGNSMCENIMEMIAHETGIEVDRIRSINSKEDNPIPELINYLKKEADYIARAQAIKQFNAENRWRKKAIKLSPMFYPVEYFGLFNILISIYHADGTVSVTHGGIEMGQGINTKVAQVCAFQLGISVDKIIIKPSNSIVSPNAGFSGGSITSESACFAAFNACKILNEKLKPFRDDPKNSSWEKVVEAAFNADVELQALYSAFPAKELQTYNVYGVTMLELELDVLTGNHIVLRVDLLEDTGQSISPQIDVGQIEGAFVMGLGYWTSEEIKYDKITGALLTNRTWNYKPPGLKDIPMDFRVYFKRNSKNTAGVLRSKATGEPALNMSVVITHALREAIKAAREDSGRYAGEWIQLENPCTPENIMKVLHHKLEDFTLRLN